MIRSRLSGATALFLAGYDRVADVDCYMEIPADPHFRTAFDIAKEELAHGGEMALSAMTAHALLQQRGYTLNPF